MVDELSKNESLELFSYHAFKRPFPFEDFMDISESIVSYTGGLPLALEVLGSSLFRRTQREWRSTFEKLQQIPNNQIHKILKISYDALDDDKVKEIFLDIAFFLDGMDKDDEINILDSCGFFPDIGISILVERCFLGTNWENKLWMHDLIRKMGREIVREESVKEPGKRSRLWREEDACHVLEKHKGTDKIEGVMLDLTTQKHFETKSFESMPNLRLLQINNVYLTGGFENSFQELRWLCWHYCPLGYLPSTFHPPKLVSLDMQHSNVKTLWQGIKILQSLKILNVCYSRCLTTTPDFGGVVMLEKLSFRSCSSLLQVHPSIGLLDMLVHLDLNECSNLKQLPEQLGNLQCLKKLDACDTAIEKLPDSIRDLYSLVELNLKGCNNLKNLPSSICNLSSLEELDLSTCMNLESLPEQMEKMQSLKWFDACGTAIEQLPDSIGCLSTLVNLRFDRCVNLISLPNSISNLSSLHKLDIEGCSNLEQLPEQLGNIQFLSWFNLNDCPSLLSIPELPLNQTLFDPGYCTLLEQLPNLSSLKDLTSLDLSSCSSLQSLPELPPNLDCLYLTSCTNLQSVLEFPPNLEFFAMCYCTSLQLLPDLPPNLGTLDARGCTSLEKLQNLPALQHESHAAYRL